MRVIFGMGIYVREWECEDVNNIYCVRNIIYCVRNNIYCVRKP